jgi:hypothetical protein
VALDLRPRRDDRADLAADALGDLRHVRQRLGVVQGDDDLAGLQQRDGQRAEPASRLRRDQRLDVEVDREDVEVDVVDAVVVGERVREVVVGDVAVVDEDVDVAAPRARGVQRGVHRALGHEAARDEGVAEELMRRSRGARRGDTRRRRERARAVNGCVRQGVHWACHRPPISELQVDRRQFEARPGVAAPGCGYS